MLVTVIVIRWGWISLLVSEVVLTLTFLIWTIIEGNRLGMVAVKSSALATLLALDVRSRQAMRARVDAKYGPENAASEVYVQLEGSGSLVMAHGCEPDAMSVFGFMRYLLVLPSARSSS